MVEKLVNGPCRLTLRENHDWAEVNHRDAIHKAYHFAGFNGAFGFISRVALLAERMHHHPELRVTDARVEVVLSTPDVAALTMEDIELTRAIDEVAPERDVRH